MKKLLLFTFLTMTAMVNAQTTCATATTVSSNGTLTTPTYATSTFSAGCAANKTGIRAIWYKYTPASNGEITISSDLAANNGTTYTNDTRISVFKGTCTQLQCVGYNDDVSATNYKSSVTVPVAAGTTYYFQWDNYWNVGTANANLALQFSFDFTAASCIRPSAYEFYLPDTYTQTSVSLYWNQAIGTPANYDTDWSTNFSTAAGSGTLVTASTLTTSGSSSYASSSITGATAGSNLRYFVRSNCGTSQSAWQGPYYAYLAKTLPYTTTFEDPTLNYTDGFVGFSRLTTSATSAPADYADGGAGNAMYTYNSTTQISNLRGYTRAISLQAGEQVTFNFKTRLFTTSTTGAASPMAFDVTVGSGQFAGGQTTIIQSFTENNAASYTQRTVTYTAPSTGIFHFGFHNKAAVGTTQTFLFFDTLEMTSVLSSSSFDLKSLKVYPNPVASELFIANESNITIKGISISDINGRTIKVADNFENINVSDLNTGVYFINFETENGKSTQKFIKN